MEYAQQFCARAAVEAKYMLIEGRKVRERTFSLSCT